jgi:hypothetical protein
MLVCHIFRVFFPKTYLRNNNKKELGAGKTIP